MLDVAGPYLAVALLLLVSGVWRLRRPGPTVRALRAAGVPAGPAAAHALGSAELAVAVGAVTIGGVRFAALAAIAYLIRAITVASPFWRGHATRDGPRGWLPGAAAGLAAATVAAVAAATGVPALPDVVNIRGWLVLVPLVLTLAAAWCLLRAGAADADVCPATPHAAEEPAPDGPPARDGPVEGAGSGEAAGRDAPGRGQHHAAGRHGHVTHSTGRARRP